MDVKDLHGIPLFQDLSEHDLGLIARWADEVELPEGYQLLDRGRFPHEFFVILDGSVEVTKGTDRLATLAAPDFFGEIALVEDTRRTATVSTTSPTKLMVMSRREFDAMYDQMPLVRHRIDEAIDRRLAR